MIMHPKWFQRPLRLLTLLCLLSNLCATLPAAVTTSSAPVVRESGLLRVEAPEGAEQYAQHVLSHATAAMRALNQATGDPLLTAVLFITATDQAHFEQYAGDQAENSLAVALGGQQTVVISRPAMMRAGADTIQQVLVHELAHVYLDVRCHAPVPRWVHEGVAQMLAGQMPEAAGDATLSLSAYTGGLTPLTNLVGSFPNDGVRRQMAYAQAHSAIKYLVREKHGNSLPDFLKSITGDNGREYLKSLSGGPDLHELHENWRTDLRSPLAVLTLIVGNGFFWGMASLLAIVAWVVVRRRSKEIRRRWAAEEAMAAEWNEPPHEAEWIKGDWTEDEDSDLLTHDSLDTDDDEEGEEWKRGR